MAEPHDLSASFAVEAPEEANAATATEQESSPMVFILPALLLVIILLAPITGATPSEPLVTGDQAVLGLLMTILWAVFSTESSDHPCLKAFYNVVPSLLMCYFLPGLCTTLNVFNPKGSCGTKLYPNGAAVYPNGTAFYPNGTAFDSNGAAVYPVEKCVETLYPIARDYLLPSCLVLLTISIDLPAIRNLGSKAIIMFFAATLAVIVGGPLAFLVMRLVRPATIAGDDVWRGFTTLAGSWIGGGANQAAMKEIFGASDSMFAKCAVVDALAANLWMGILLVGARHSKRIDSWLQADSSAIDELAVKLADYQEMVKKVPSTNDFILIATVGFASTGVAGFVGGNLADWVKDQYPDLSADEKQGLVFGSSFFWLVVICTTIGLLLSFTRLRSMESVGASKIGTVYLYFLVVTIGMKMNFLEIAKEPWLLVVGIVWIFFIACVLIATAKLIRSPFFFLAVGSQANIGGAASAPVIAAAFHPALSSVGVLLAVLGYAVGSYGAPVCGAMLEFVACLGDACVDSA